MKKADYCQCQRLFGLILFIALLSSGCVFAQEYTYAHPVDSQKQVYDFINQMRLRVNNHESELRQIDEKFNSVESIIETLRRQVQEHSKSHKEQLQASKEFLEAKTGGLEQITKGLVSDVQQIKSKLNESSTFLTQVKQQLAAVEKSIEQQNQNIDSLHVAMKTLMQALQDGEAVEPAGDSYQVKSGDTLEKIANAHATTVKALKELNNLATDRIRIGQKLKIPSK